MKSKYVLLVIGILGVLASLYMIVKGDSITSTITGFICGISLIYGSYELGRQELNPK